MSANVLGLRCPCGHEAFHHPTAEQHAAYMASTGGRHVSECNGRDGNFVNAFGPVACRCIADREEVIAAAQGATA